MNQQGGEVKRAAPPFVVLTVSKENHLRRKDALLDGEREIFSDGKGAAIGRRIGKGGKREQKIWEKGLTDRVSGGKL